MTPLGAGSVVGSMEGLLPAELVNDEKGELIGTADNTSKSSVNLDKD